MKGTIQFIALIVGVDCPSSHASVVALVRGARLLVLLQQSRPLELASAQTVVVDAEVLRHDVQLQRAFQSRHLSAEDTAPPHASLVQQTASLGLAHVTLLPSRSLNQITAHSKT